MTRTAVVAMMVVGGAAFGALAQAPVGDVDAYVAATLQRTHTPGVSVAVMRDGAVVLTSGVGIANLEWRTPVSDESVYEVLSVGKQFTAAAILLLARDHRVELDQPASRYLSNLPPAWKPVTVRQLLSHTAGIPDYTTASGWRETIRLERSPDALIGSVASAPLLFAPGSSWRYSNTDYYVLGRLIEEVTGSAYGPWIEEHVFRPLAMTQTRLNDLHAIIPLRAQGYHWSAPRLQIGEAISPTQMWAAGAFVSTAKDLGKWLMALETGALLTRAELEQMWTPAALARGGTAAYGLGTELDSDNGHRSVGHQGGGHAYNAALLFYPDDHLGVAVLGNLTQAPALEMARHIAALYVPALSGAANTGIVDTSKELTDRFRATLVDAAAGRADASRVAADARQALLPFLQSVGPRFLGPMGTLVDVVLLADTSALRERTRRYRTTFSGGQRVIWTVVFAADGTIRSLEPKPE